MGAKKDRLVEMLAGKNEIGVCIYIEGVTKTTERVPSRVAIKQKNDLLILNNMIPVPMDDQYITAQDNNRAEIVFIDPDNQAVHIEIHF